MCGDPSYGMMVSIRNPHIVLCRLLQRKSYLLLPHPNTNSGSLKEVTNLPT